MPSRVARRRRPRPCAARSARGSGRTACRAFDASPDRALGEPRVDVGRVVGSVRAVRLQLAVVVDRVCRSSRRSSGRRRRASRPSPSGPRSGSPRRTRSGTCRCGSSGSRRGRARPAGSRCRRASGSRPRAQLFQMTPWLWAYWPVRKVARDGQQSGKLTTLRSNVVAPRADEPPRLRHHRHRAEVLVVGHDHDDVGPLAAAAAAAAAAAREGEQRELAGSAAHQSAWRRP